MPDTAHENVDGMKDMHGLTARVDGLRHRILILIDEVLADICEEGVRIPVHDSTNEDHLLSFTSFMAGSGIHTCTNDARLSSGEPSSESSSCTIWYA